MFHIKICGITSNGDALLACQAGADAIGLNFYTGSPRYVSPSQAGDIICDLPTDVQKVGVFVNAKASDVCRIFDQLELDAIQLHGDEPPPFLGLLGSRPVIRAFRCRNRGLQPVVDYLNQCAALRCVPQCILTDAYYPGQYGGTGRVFDWTLISEVRQTFHGIEVILAGGLTPSNVATAIATGLPNAVDTASGVESSARVKDPVLIGEFVQNAANAFSRIDTRK